MTAQTHTGTTVTAFIHSKFSRRLLPGATHSDMADLHDEQAAFHRNQIHDLNRAYMHANSRKERGQIKKIAKFHAKRAAKHENRANFFHTLHKASKVSDVPFESKRNYNEDEPARIPHVRPNAASPMHEDFEYSIPAKKPMSPPGSGMKGMTKDTGNAITHTAAKIWHSFAPHVKHIFTQKRPNSPITKSHLRNEPKMPMPDNVVHKAQMQQADFHNEQATKAKAVALKAKSPAKKVAAQKVAKVHKNLADNHAKVSEAVKPAATPVEKPAMPVKQNKGPTTVKPMAKPMATKPASTKPMKPTNMPVKNKVKPINPAKV